MLATSLVDTPPDFFNSPDVSHLHSLNFGIEAVMHFIISRRFTNVTILFPVCIARIESSNALNFYKFFGGLPPSLLFEGSLVILPYYSVPVGIIFLKLRL